MHVNPREATAFSYGTGYPYAGGGTSAVGLNQENLHNVVRSSPGRLHLVADQRKPVLPDPDELRLEQRRDQVDVPNPLAAST